MKTLAIVVVLVAIVALGWWAWSKGLFGEVERVLTPPPPPPREFGAAAPGGSANTVTGSVYGSAAAGVCNYVTGGKGGQVCTVAGDVGAKIGDEVDTELPKNGVVKTVAVSNPIVAGHIYVGKKAWEGVKSLF